MPVVQVWTTTAEVEVEPGDMPSGDTQAFKRVTMWASSHDDYVQKLGGISRQIMVDPSTDYGDEVNQMFDERIQDRNAVRLGTFYSYKPD